MEPFKVFPKSWSLKKKLLLGLTVLALALLIPVLCINFLPANTGALQEGTGEPQITEEVSNPSPAEGTDEPDDTEEVSNPSSTEDAGFEVWSITMGTEWVPDPATAIASGTQGYVDIIFVDDPEGLVLHRGEQWTGTVLLQMVSHTPDLTEIQINVDPQRSPSRYGVLVNLKGSETSFWGTLPGQFVDFTALLSYSPSGAFVIKAGESLTTSLTIQIPKDFPEEIEKFHLASLGIWPDDRSVPVICADPIAKTVLVR